MDTQTKDLLLKKAFHYLTFRSRTEAEMRLYLQKKAPQYNPQIKTVEDIIKYLKEANYINDKNFIEEYINFRIKSKPRSLFLIKKELQQKGISEDDIADYLSNNNVDETSLAERLLNKKRNSWNNLAYLQKKKKAIDFLRTKGFDFDIIRGAFDAVFTDET